MRGRGGFGGHRPTVVRNSRTVVVNRGPTIVNRRGPGVGLGAGLLLTETALLTGAMAGAAAASSSRAPRETVVVQQAPPATSAEQPVVNVNITQLPDGTTTTATPAQLASMPPQYVQTAAPQYAYPGQPQYIPGQQQGQAHYIQPGQPQYMALSQQGQPLYATTQPQYATALQPQYVAMPPELQYGGDRTVGQTGAGVLPPGEAPPAYGTEAPLVDLGPDTQAIVPARK